MQDDQLHHAEAHTPRRPAIWPWLLIPLVTLALYFALIRLKDSALERAGVSPPAGLGVHSSAPSDEP